MSLNTKIELSETKPSQSPGTSNLGNLMDGEDSSALHSKMSKQPCVADRKNLCERCGKMVKRLDKHRCMDPKQMCEICSKMFKCLDKHKCKVLKHKCELCSKVLKRLDRHKCKVMKQPIQSQPNHNIVDEKMQSSDECGDLLSVQSSGNQSEIGTNTKFCCLLCPSKFKQKRNLNQHIRTKHELQEKKQTALNGKFEVIEIVFKTNSDSDYYNALNYFCSILDEKRKTQPRKVYLTAQVKFSRMLASEEEVAEPFFHTKPVILLETSDIVEFLENSVSTVNEYIESFTQKGSNWEYRRVSTLAINISKFNPFAGGSYIELPDALKNKYNLLNINNNDNLCFIYSVLAKLHPVNNYNYSRKASTYQRFTNELNIDGLDFPVPVRQIDTFERNNPKIVVNVFGFDKHFFPIRISKKKLDDSTVMVDLLFLSLVNNSHYVLIKNFNSLVGSQMKCRGSHAEFCRRCFQKYSSIEKLNRHLEICTTQQAQRISMPNKGDKLEFKNIWNMEPLRYACYADFESIISETKEHIPSCFGYVIIEGEKKIYSRFLYRGEDPVKVFFDRLFLEVEKIKLEMKNSLPIQWTEETIKRFNDASHCEICNVKFGGDVKKIADHFHYDNGTFRKDWSLEKDGNLRYALCETCNKALCHKYFHLPIFLHCGSTYDFNLILQHLGSITDRRITVIPCNSSKYIAIRVSNLLFLDSYRHLSDSLANLTDTLHKSNHTFPIARQVFSDNDLPYVTKKQHYMYSYMDSFSKYDETKLPPHDRFYNDIKKENITSAEYSELETLWSRFKFENLGEFTDFYLSIDCLLLAEIFQVYRQSMYSYFTLDPACYVSLPSYSLDAALKFSKCEINQMYSYDHYLFLMKSLRGGYSVVNKHFSKANNENIPETYDPSSPYCELYLLDKNNLYGHCLRDWLPVGGFKFLSSDELAAFNLEAMMPQQPKGYFLEVDIVFDQTIHDKLSDLPFCMERLVPDVSEFSQDLQETLELKRTKCPKLIATLYNKKKYVAHYLVLKFYVKHGAKIEKIHRALEFDQYPVFREFVDFNTEKRRNAPTPVESTMHKLIVNSLYGKLLERKERQKCIELVQKGKRADKLIAKSNFRRFDIFCNDLVAVESIRANIVLDRPIGMGVTVLEISKLQMYEFWYDYLKPIFGDSVSLMLMDTDSFLIEHKPKSSSDSFFNKIKDTSHLFFDTSNFDPSHELYSKKNEKAVNFMKIENATENISEVVCLRPKLYSILFSSKKEIRKAKGTPSAIKKKELRHVQYKDALFKKKVVRNNANVIRAIKHRLFSLSLNKLSLSANDDKRYWLNDVKSLPYGHYKILE